MRFTALFALIFGALLLAGPAMQAQASHEEVAIVQNLFGMEKRNIYQKVMKLSAADSVGFWPLYDEYEMERKDIGKKKIELMQMFVSKYPNISHDEIDDIVNDTDDINSDLRKLIKRFYDKIKDKSSAQTAAMFYQMETYIMNVVNSEISNAMPFIGDFKIVTKKQ
jgi:hypothetical protein